MAARIIVTLIMIGLATFILKFTEPIVNNIGRNDLAERYLGVGGTYTMWKIIGVLLVLASFLVLSGDIHLGI